LVHWSKLGKSEEVGRKISEAKKGKTSWRKGLKGIDSKETNEKRRIAHLGRKLSQESKDKISKTKKRQFQEHPEAKQKCAYWKDKKRTEESKINMNVIAKSKEFGKWMIGKKHTEETKQKIRESNSGEKAWQWNGGSSYFPYPSKFNRQLKEQIRKRDSYRCQECFRHENELKQRLAIHHIDFNKDNLNENNLISLCKSCHAQCNYKNNEWIKYFQNKQKERGID
jgi:hypothetical protein